MPNKLFNWTFRDVDRFLKNHNFKLNYTNGSHYYYIGHYGKIFRHVCVPFHSSKTIKSRTLKGIILQSGMLKEEWLK